MRLRGVLQAMYVSGGGFLRARQLGRVMVTIVTTLDIQGLRVARRLHTEQVTSGGLGLSLRKQDLRRELDTYLVRKGVCGVFGGRPARSSHYSYF